MYSLPRNHAFRLHADNLAAVRAGLVQAERLHKNAIREGDGAAVSFLGRMHAINVGMMAEARLNKILWDPQGFNALERELLVAARSHFDRWMLTVDLAFRRHYRVPVHEKLGQSLDRAVAAQLQELRGTLEQDLKPVIEDRNKTAHGQWRWFLNEKNLQELREVRAAPKPLNYRAIQARSKAIEALGDIVHVLAVSEPTFQRDYDAALAQVRDWRTLMDGRDYEQFAAQLRDRARRGRHTAASEEISTRDD